MRAILFDDVNSIRVGDYPDPEILAPTDAIVRVTTAAICGSDLHLLHGRIPGMRPGSPMGHEFVGIVEQVGADVETFKPGDRVVGSFLIVCGRCWFCQRRDFTNCDQLWVLGYGMFTGDLDGAHAEHVRVPVADWNLHHVAPTLSDEHAIFAGDILTTGTYITARAGIAEGDTVAIIGSGPVGLFTLMNVRATNPGQILMVDVAEDRLRMAESLGAIAINSSKVNPVVEIQRRTEERGADVVIECVGLAPAFTTALDAARAGGTVAVIGVHSDLSYDFPLGELWRRSINIVMGGTCNVQGYWDRALELVESGAVDPTVIISHTMSLEDGVKAYEMFDRHEAMKVILKP